MARLGAGVRKRTDGTLEKRFTVNGRRISVYGKTHKELTSKEQEVRKQIEAGIYTDNRNITLSKYFEEWLENKRNVTKGNTLKTYRAHFHKHLGPALGSRKIQQLERREILALQRDLAEKLSPNTANHVLLTLRIILQDAVRDDIIVKNPASSVKNLKLEDKAADTIHRALTEEDQKAFMDEMKGSYYYEFVAFLLSTGMRCGEVAALTWADIDTKSNEIHVNKTLTYTEDGKLTVGSPKSVAGLRDIPLTENAKEVLKSQRAKLGNVLPMHDNRIFCSPFGGYIYSHAVNRAISDTLKSLHDKGIEIEHFTAHALRDTFATRYIEQGGNPQTLKTILGHSSLAMTMDLYAHVLPKTKQDEMNRIKIII